MNIIDIDYKLLLNRAITIYGESGSGKSAIIKDFLRKLQPHISQIIVFSKSEESRPHYSFFMPRQCILFKITEDKLNKIWKRQEAMSATYNKATELAPLAKLFARVCSPDEQAIVNQIDVKRRMEIEKLTLAAKDGPAPHEKINKINEDTTEMLLEAYRHVIRSKAASINAAAISDDEKFSLRYVNFNPRMIIVFDDCTTEIEKFKKHPIINEIFFRGRHSCLTAIFAIHTDKALETDQRKNSFISIFTQKPSAHAYFHRSSNDFDSATKRAVDQACNEVFGGGSSMLSGEAAPNYTKLVWIRSHQRFYKFTADISKENQMFGATIIIKYCDEIKSKKKTISADNQYAAQFGL